MQNKTRSISAILLVISLGIYFGVVSDGSIRTVEFLSIFATGALAGVLLAQFFKK